MSGQSMLTRVLKSAVERGAADVHAKAGDVFRARVDGHLVPLTKQRLTPEQTRALAATFAGLTLDDPRLDQLRDFDCSWGIQGVGRFRVNVLRQRSSFMVVLRVIPFSVPSPEGLELPEVVSRFADLPNGLVLVSGTAGSGKTSTVAAMVHHINRSSARHVITLEDPIEYLHRDLTGSITQREVGTDTEDTAVGIQAALRQDPDVLVVGELRDPVAMDRAVRAAESGILVIAALSAVDVAQALLQAAATTMPDEREVGRMRLAGVLRAVMAQRLVPRESGEGRVPVVEWLEVTDQVRAAVTAGAEPAAIRKAIDKAVKEGAAETFAMAGLN
ncbi:MAG: Flp pilus assembly complex ATPase component TadA [Gemmatimonadetes bacterium]|nr:Flp pilus assembly complex ATPase component TadA [Gemmatimonadota bacterium]